MLQLPDQEHYRTQTACHSEDLSNMLWTILFSQAHRAHIVAHGKVGRGRLKDQPQDTSRCLGKVAIEIGMLKINLSVRTILLSPPPTLAHWPRYLAPYHRSGRIQQVCTETHRHSTPQGHHTTLPLVCRQTLIGRLLSPSSCRPP